MLTTFLLNFIDSWARLGVAMGPCWQGAEEGADCLKMPVGNIEDKPSTENQKPGAGLAFQNH